MTYRIVDLEIDNTSGLVTEWYESDDGDIGIKYMQDAEPVFEQTLADRNDGVAWTQGLKSGMVHAFRIPVGVVMELMAIGVNVYQAPTADIVAGLKKINRYDACDMTGKRLVKTSHK